MAVIFPGVQVRAIVAMSKKTFDYSKTTFDEDKLKMISNHMYHGLRMSRGRFQNKLNSNPIGFFVRSLHSFSYFTAFR